MYTNIVTKGEKHAVVKAGHIERFYVVGYDKQDDEVYLTKLDVSCDSVDEATAVMLMMDSATEDNALTQWFCSA